MGGGFGWQDPPSKVDLLLDKMQLLKLRYYRYMQEQQGTPVLSGSVFQKKRNLHTKQKKTTISLLEDDH